MELMRRGKEEKEKGKERGNEEKPEGRDEKKKPGFAAKVVLAAGLMIAAATGCTERTVNNYNCPDGEARDTVEEVAEDSATEPDVPEEVADTVEDTAPEILDVIEEDAEPEVIDVVGEDVTEEEVECVADRTPVTCDSSSPIAEGVMTLTDSLEAGNITFELEATEVRLSGERRAIIRAVDECGEVIMMDTVAEGQTLEFFIEGADYAVTVNTVHVSDYNPWTDVSISMNCDSWCESTRGIMDQGDAIPFSGFNLRFTDIDVMSTPGTPAALFDIEDGVTGDVVYSLRIPNGDHEYVFGSRIDVLDLAAGYTFGAKWAEVAILGPCD